MNKIKRLGIEIKRRREALGQAKGRKVSQQEIADKIEGVGRSGYSKWEKGETFPDSEKWDNIEQALEVPTGWLVSQMYESFELSGSGSYSIEKPKACITCLETNNHMQDIAAWINTQDEPEMHWAELKSHLRRIEPDFAEFLKKRSRASSPDTTIQRSKTG